MFNIKPCLWTRAFTMGDDQRTPLVSKHPGSRSHPSSIPKKECRFRLILAVASFGALFIYFLGLGQTQSSREYSPLHGPHFAPRRLGLAAPTPSEVPVVGSIEAEFLAALDAGKEEENPFYNAIRLPESLVPVNYTLSLDVDLDPHFRYTGTVSVTLDCRNDTDLIVLHAKGETMKISTASIIPGSPGEPRVAVTAAMRHDEHEQLQIKLSRSLTAGEKYHFNLSFSANLSDSMTGFYKSSYPKKAGVVSWLATTHFEPTNARQAFPCFDEPALKANFSIAITHASRLSALSNMPPEETTDLENGRTMTKFEESVKMSTYLVAFVISDFTRRTRLTAKRQLPVSVWAPYHQITQANLALDAAAEILEYFEDFFGLQFPLPKVDLVAVPDFAAGAMENWGLITYRATALLIDPEESSTRNKQWVVTVVSHELAHQWFGNIVTMDWWDDLWLNEGFASYVEDLGTQKFDPSMCVVEQFASSKLTTALSLDALASTHPIATTVTDPNEINSIFDAISYHKGSSVIRMLEGFLGEKIFHKGLSAYLNTHAYGNAQTKDLWKAWSEAGDGKIDVETIMNSWTKQEGFPLVTITVNANRTGYTASQSRFFASPSAKLTAAEKIKELEKDPENNITGNPIWHIPLTIVTQPKRRGLAGWIKNSHISGQGGYPDMEMVWMTGGGALVEWEKPVGWVKANVDQVGVYRVTYDDETWGLLAAQLRKNHRVLTPTDRAGLIGDAFALARASYVGLTLPLNLTRYLNKERSYLPWSAALKGLGTLGHLLRSRPAYGEFCKYLNALVGPPIRRVGWREGGSHLDRYLRTELYNAALECDNDMASTGVLREFQRWSKGGSWKENKRGFKVPPDHRYLVYATGVRRGGEKAWQKVHTAHEAATLAMALDESEIRRQDSIGLICAVADNPIGESLAWEFVQENWKELRKRYGSLSFELGTLLKCVIQAQASSSAFRLEGVKGFFEGRDVGAAASALKQAIEEAEGNVAFLQRHEAELRAWLRAAAKNVGRWPSWCSKKSDCPIST
ncbi:hypothetical protein AAMO2058_000581100 [Amorphochlora amoebiformis]